MLSCKQHTACSRLYRKTGRVKLHDIYRVYLGKCRGQDIWIIDGARVVRKLYPAFVAGGNDQRYRFNPENEVWIDNRMGVEEFAYTLEHEFIERKLMRERGWSYDRAHAQGGLELEKGLRQRQRRRVALKERNTPAMPVGERESPPDKKGRTVSLDGVYRHYFGKRYGLDIWVVDGTKVRGDIYGDFCFAGHDLKYRFVPKGEIWLDAAMSVEEAWFSLIHEASERKLMARGKTYDDAYPAGLVTQLNEREHQENLARDHEEQLPPVRYGTRERGAKKKK